MPASEFAAAKVNLALHITGQRDDGYHLLDSLVGFASIGDTIEAAISDRYSLTTTGDFATQMPPVADNLITKAVDWFAKKTGQDGRVAITLEKNLPSAAGIGGASADAAAVVRALARLWDQPLPGPKEMLFLGADVPMCLASRLCRAQGIGEDLSPAGALFGLSVVLVNPRVAVPTPQVFAALDSRNNPPMSARVGIDNPEKFLAWLSKQRNDLQETALSIAPEIAPVLAALNDTTPDLARMSGSGATCFALYHSAQSAAKAARELAKNHPNWWVVTGHLL